jgi:hypothetical protein
MRAVAAVVGTLIAAVVMRIAGTLITQGRRVGVGQFLPLDTS